MALFDAAASSYDTFCSTPMGKYVDGTERGMLLELLQPRAGEEIADLGCGTGLYAVTLAELGCKVTGIDISQGMLDLARAKARPGLDLRFLQGDLSRLPRADARFDAALMQVTLEFVADPAAVLSEAMRVLRPGGRLVVGLIHGPGPWARSYREKARQRPDSVYREAHFWTLRELRATVGLLPVATRFGLYVGPDELRDVQRAAELERERAGRPTDEAGFLAVRFERKAPATGNG
jgi:ubiquinone/menaquinone biosynthesis C-methylase UbiE